MSWGAQLEGERFDLLDWEEVLYPPFDPWVQSIPLESETLYVLRSRDFDGVTIAEEVLARARLLIDRMNGALALERGSEPVRTNTIVEFSSDDSILTRLSFAVGSCKGRARCSSVGRAVDIDGNPLPPTPPTPSLAQRWQAATETNLIHDQEAKKHTELISDLMVHVGRCDNWYDIYKSIEFAEKLAGCERALKKLVGTSGDALKNARASANHYRHARAYRPNQPTTIEEARELAFVAARIVLNSSTSINN